MTPLDRLDHLLLRSSLARGQMEIIQASADCDKVLRQLAPMLIDVARCAATLVADGDSAPASFLRLRRAVYLLENADVE